MNGYKLLISRVDRGLGNEVVSLARSAGAQGGTIVLGRGTSSSTLMQILGLGDTERDLVLIIIREEDFAGIVQALDLGARQNKKLQGVAVVVDVSALIRSQSTPEPFVPKASPGENMHTHTLISVVVNSGYAGDIMHAARRAGAKGGTLMDARGTARESDAKFFGVAIVPEKEFLMILVENSQVDGILAAIKSCKCLEQPGIGIVFCMPVDDVIHLGQK